MNTTTAFKSARLTIKLDQEQGLSILGREHCYNLLYNASKIYISDAQQC